MLCVVSPYGFVCVTVKVKREGGSERRGGGWGGGGRGRGQIFKGEKGCAHVWCAASDKQYMTGMAKTVSPLLFEMNIRHYMLKMSICVCVCAGVNPRCVYVRIFASGSTWRSSCTSYPWQGLLLVQRILGFQGRLSGTVGEEGTA